MPHRLTCDLDILDDRSEGNLGALSTALEAAVECRIDGIAIRVLSLGDLIMAKRAAGPPKDLEALAELESLLLLELGDG